MSLLQQLITADNKQKGWSNPYSLYIYEVLFTDREMALDALEEMLPHYNEIWERETWEGIEQTTGNTCHTDKTSAQSHIWVDENDKGFSLCVLFSNTKQRNKISEIIEILYKEEETAHHVLSLSEEGMKRFGILKSATHSVEVDVPSHYMTPAVVKDFTNVAVTIQNVAPLYIDTISKDGFSRLKAYFGEDKAAAVFLQAADVAFVQPRSSSTANISEPKVRKFPATRLQHA